MEPVSKTIKQKQVNSSTVNSNKEITESTVNSSNTVNSDPFKEELDGLLEKYGREPESLGAELSRILKDDKSMGYYTLLIREHGAAKIMPLAYQAKEMDEQGKVRTTRAKYFMGIMRRLKLKTKFKKQPSKTIHK